MVSTTFFTSPPLLTSATIGRHSPPCRWTEAAVSWAEGPFQSITTTRAPSCPNRSAVARPMPEPPPVTITTLPANSLTFVSHLPEWGLSITPEPLLQGCESLRIKVAQRHKSASGKLYSNLKDVGQLQACSRGGNQNGRMILTTLNVERHTASFQVDWALADKVSVVDF